jgi:hypothetical protein
MRLATSTKGVVARPGPEVTVQVWARRGPAGEMGQAAEPSLLVAALVVPGPAIVH